MSVKKNVELDELVTALMDRIRPLMMQDKADVRMARQGVLTGVQAIAEYLGHNYDPRTTCRRYTRWYHKYGFPMSRDIEGEWVTTKSLIDSWIQKRELMQRVFREMGFYHLDGRYKDGKMRDVQVEKMKPAERSAVVVEINERKVREGLRYAAR